ncbi:Phox homologous domain-containing protein [Trichoderma sp. SZMC 28014]
MASVVEPHQDNAQGDLANQTGPSPPAESGATPPLSRTLSRINTNLSSRDSRGSQDGSNHGGDNDGALHSALSNTSSITSPPPYWPHASLHQRNISNMSTESFLPAEAIRLRDNDANDDDRNSACWAKSVEITDFIFVNGSNTNIGAFIVWNISVETMNGSYMNIRKRYSEFDDFRRKLTQSFPNFRAAVPELPPKSAIFKFRPKFLEKRRAGLQYFLNCILLNPEFSGSPVLKDFLFA